MKLGLILLMFFLSLFHCSTFKNVQSQTKELEMQNSQSQITTPTHLSGTLYTFSSDEPDVILTELFEYIQTNQSTFHLIQPEEELQLEKQTKDELGFRHITLQRVHQAIPLKEEKLVFHVNKDKELYMFQGKYHPSLEKSRIASRFSQKKLAKITAKALDEKYDIQENSLLYVFQDEQPVLCHKIIASSNPTNAWQLLIDADSGAIIEKQSLIQERRIKE